MSNGEFVMPLQMHHIWGSWKPHTWSFQTVYPRREWLQASGKLERLRLAAPSASGNTFFSNAILICGLRNEREASRIPDASIWYFPPESQSKPWLRDLEIMGAYLIEFFLDTQAGVCEVDSPVLMLCKETAIGRQARNPSSCNSPLARVEV